MPTLGPMELLIVAGVIVLLFDSTKLPQLMRGMGEGMKEFKKATRDDDEPTAVALNPMSVAPNLSEKERELDRERERLRERERELDRERERLTSGSSSSTNQNSL